jgi:hypothetical protein
MHLLQAVAQHWPVNLIQEFVSNMNLVRWRDSQEVTVEGCVVNLAQREAVRDVREPVLISVRRDMGRVQ